MGRLRASRTLDGKSCPGEHKCTTDLISGEIGGTYGSRQGRTLENYCHGEVASFEKGLKQGCPLFPTKPENTPQSLYGAIEAAETLRRYKHHGILPPVSELSAWEFCCFDTAEEASDEVEAEYLKEASNQGSTPQKTPMGISGQIEEGGAMSGW